MFIGDDFAFEQAEAAFAYAENLKSKIEKVSTRYIFKYSSF